jgi:hypothetical protein
MVMTRIALIVATLVIASSASAQEPQELRDMRREYDALRQPSEADRVRYVTRLVRLRESFTRKEADKMFAIDAEVRRHPMPAAVASQTLLAPRLLGGWQSPRHPYFFRRDGSWTSDEETNEPLGTWRIDGDRFFQNYTDEPSDKGSTIILLNDDDLVLATPDHVFYLRRGTTFPWRG